MNINKFEFIFSAKIIHTFQRDQVQRSHPRESRGPRIRLAENLGHFSVAGDRKNNKLIIPFSFWCRKNQKMHWRVFCPQSYPYSWVAKSTITCFGNLATKPLWQFLKLVPKKEKCFPNTNEKNGPNPILTNTSPVLAGVPAALHYDAVALLEPHRDAPGI